MYLYLPKRASVLFVTIKQIPKIIQEEKQRTHFLFSKIDYSENLNKYLLTL